MINYDQDFYGWMQELATLLRAGRLSGLDINNLIEEVGSMGKNERRELENHLVVLLLYLLQWKFQVNRR